MGAVIDRKSFDKISGYLDDAKRNAKIIQGGDVHGEDGFFVQPTLVETSDPGYRLLCEEIFGPVVTAHVYPDAEWPSILEVIDRNSFRTQKNAIEEARQASGARILVGGECDDSEGWFVRPTVIEASDPGYRTLCDELFGPVLTVHVYDPAKWRDTLDLVDRTSPYALTGAVFAQDRHAVQEAFDYLRNAAGNFYINDKPTGAVVGHQPFGGARASGTNDKAGSILNLLRWISPRSIKETFVPATDYRYPFMGGDGRA
jgi:acyl-CoA reductase-like NAD-dependent aldehyde dehydrogenase